MEYFFTPQTELPSGAGFSLGSREHITALILLLGCTLLLLLMSSHMSHGAKARMLQVLSSSMLVLELGKDFILGLLGAFSIGYLPLHLCSMSMFVCLYYTFHPQSKRTGQVLYSVVLPGALSALLFPNWNVFPLLHFQSIHSFIYHGLLLFFGLFPVVSGQSRPGLEAILPSMGCLCLFALPAGLFDAYFHTNYMFLRSPSKGSPLEFLTVIPGKYGYLAGLFLLALSVVTLMNLPFWLAGRWKARRE